MKKRGIEFIGILLLNSAALRAQSTTVISTYKIPAETLVFGKPFGGISGIDYDAGKKNFYLISDDRSIIDFARIYEGKILTDGGKIHTVAFSKLIYLKNESEKAYDTETVDFEAVRLIKNNRFIIGDEGGNKSNAGIKIYSNSGKIIQSDILDNALISQTRKNKSFESITVYSKKNSFVFTTEAALVSDGNESDFQNASFVRMIARNFKTGKNIWQAYYRLGKIPQNKNHEDSSIADIGVSEILMYDKSHFFTIERAGYKTGENKFTFDCRLYWVTLIKNKDKKSDFRWIAEKKEIMDFSQLKDGKQNFEGLAYGPVMNGKKTLVAVSDNNFSNDPTTLILLQLNIN